MRGDSGSHTKYLVDNNVPAYRQTNTVEASRRGMASLDVLDRAIIDQLKQDARASNVFIAEAVGSSEGTVRARIRRLIDDGIIQAFTVRVRGANVRAVVEATVHEDVLTRVAAEEIRATHGVAEVWEVTGETDLLIIVDVDNTEALNDIIDSIRAAAGTKATRTRVILNEFNN